MGDVENGTVDNRLVQLLVLNATNVDETTTLLKFAVPTPANNKYTVSTRKVPMKMMTCLSLQYNTMMQATKTGKYQSNSTIRKFRSK